MNHGEQDLLSPTTLVQVSNEARGRQVLDVAGEVTRYCEACLRDYSIVKCPSVTAACSLVSAHCGPTATSTGTSWPVMMVCGLLPSRPASPIVPSSALVQYRWLLSTATAAVPTWSVMMVCGLLPSRLASPIVSSAPLAQYRWLLSTATPSGALWPVMMVCGLLPSRLASPIVPAPLFDHYRWLLTTATAAGPTWPVMMVL